jgi:UDP-N-acetylmuramoylalanine--D-glutamate ligase
MIQDFKDKRVTVMGLGRFGGGVGVTRWLAQNGAKVLATDNAPPGKLQPALEQIADLDIELRLGEHRESDFRETDLVVVSPAVPESNRYLRAAREAGVEITTEINLFVERCPARCVGVTGSVGKSTVTAMIGHVLERTLLDRRVWVGGNVGVSLLENLNEIGREDLVVLELSSFQLARTPAVRWSPHVAVITNISPNHLDWHGDFAAYVAAKLEIVRFQDPQGDAIVIGDHENLREHLAEHARSPDKKSRGLRPARSCDKKSRGLQPARCHDSEPRNIWRYALDNDTPIAICDDQRIRWEGVELAIPGRHNRENAAAALTVAHVLGVGSEQAAGALATFEGLEHRLQRVAVRDGVTYYNDSKSTTPEAAITAMNAIEGPLLIILGGYDKGSNLTPAAEVAARRARFAACIGKTGATFVEAIRSAGGQAELFTSLSSAVAACRGRAEPGDAILLSPACASWDMFADYRVRGEEFTRLANVDAGT